MMGDHLVKGERSDTVGRSSLLWMQKAKPNNVEAMRVAWRIVLLVIKKEILPRWSRGVEYVSDMPFTGVS